MNNHPHDDDKEMPRGEFAVELAVNAFLLVCLVAATLSLALLLFPIH